jgi:hypothetical protein
MTPTLDGRHCTHSFLNLQAMEGLTALLPVPFRTEEFSYLPPLVENYGVFGRKLHPDQRFLDEASFKPHQSLDGAARR